MESQVPYKSRSYVSACCVCQTLVLGVLPHFTFFESRAVFHSLRKMPLMTLPEQGVGCVPWLGETGWSRHF